MLLLLGFLATPYAVSSLAARLSRSGYCNYSADLGGLFGVGEPFEPPRLRVISSRSGT